MAPSEVDFVTWLAVGFNCGAAIGLEQRRCACEPHIRAQLSQARSGDGVLLHGLLSERCAADKQVGDMRSAAELVSVHADLLVEGNAHARLDGAVTRLSVEPGVCRVSWHAAAEEASTRPPLQRRPTMSCGRT